MPFAGRAAELSQVLDAVLPVPTGGLVAVAVSGEAGIGRSRLLVEATDRLRSRGWRVLAVPGDRLQRRIPYGTLAAAVRALQPDNAYTDGLRAETVAALEAGSGSDFARACATTTRLLAALSAAGPLVVVADDVADLDEDCLTLFTVVLSRLAPAPLAVLLSTRSHLAEPSPAAEELLARLAEGAELVPLELGVLTPEQIADVVTPALGGRPDDTLAAQLHLRADGNPFFAIEIARSLAGSGLLTRAGDAVRLDVPPDRIRLDRRDAVLRRVVPLGPACREVARALAVLRTVDLARIGLVAQVADLPEPAVAAAFDELVRAGVAVASPGDNPTVAVRDEQRRYRFAHPIVAEALYDDIGPAQRRQLHGRAARPLAAARSRGEPVDLLDLARHVSESAEPADADAVMVLADAARSALGSAPETAAGLCERALSLLGPDGEGAAGLLSLRCRALARASRPAEAAACGREALGLLPPGPERYRTGTAVISSLFLLDRIGEVIEVADALVATGDPPAALLAQRAVMLAFAGRLDEAAEQGALAESAVTASPAEDVVVCGQLAMLTSMLGRHERTVALGDRAVRASGGSATLRLQALAVSASTEALAGLVTVASGRLREATDLVDGGATQLFPGELALTRVVLDWLGGRWDQALESVRPVGAELAVRREATLAGALAAVELEMRTWRGELTLAAALADRSVPRVLNLAGLYIWALAGYRAAAGDPGGAATVLRAELDRAGDTPYGCLLLSRLIELEPAGEDIDGLVKDLVRMAATSVSPWSLTVVHRTVGGVRADPQALREAVTGARAGGLTFECARAQLLLGEHDEGDGAALVDAYRTFGRLGAHGLRRRAGRRLQELGIKVPRARRGGDGLLTESEERVARLVQQGMRNREIAAALHYSPRSVEVYLTRIYAKLRVASRLELARVLDAMDRSP
ncbi:ATP-binding protein [Virgisporangium aurantiacum]|uniref:Transcriptional regulator n=1 Tax=Virgisporangium aurantiacum TaxID=175570 RepID=A0A8J4E9U3_9ACTN|nr:LuxR family transcriptional regulator [Virgisporangium aurantiacum]GIJ64092.1 transcriptional regulator [Virgisporangium aurantiacum]